MSVLVLQDGILRVEIVDPLDRTDAHFSTRYSHCGYIRQITDSRGTPLLARPTETFNPFSGEGFPDEFEQPIGYEAAADGGEFLKIGVGVQEKGRGAYNNRDRHAILRLAPVERRTDGKTAVFTQTDACGAYAYAYEKTVALSGGRLTVTHRLQNIGEADWQTLWYSHAFLPYDGETPVYIRLPDGCRLRQGGLTVRGDAYVLAPDEKVRAGVCCVWDTRGCTENFQAVGDGTRETYRARGDYAAGELQVFVNGRVVSAEPKLIVSAGAGQTRTWTTDYIFETTEGAAC